MIKGICFGNIAIDCKDAVSLRDFYADLLGGDSCIRYDCPALRSPLGLLLLFMEADFEYVKPVWPEEIGKQQKKCIYFIDRKKSEWTRIGKRNTM